ncbi:LGFP repeat-containing protein [Streptomyces sp. NPDC059701]|uniref:LGFP repeat-containing protein n=1 Tax=Streptomyces sp. NPDC059701 TaxID=3346914 RepID=UPI0036C6E2F3
MTHPGAVVWRGVQSRIVTVLGLLALLTSVLVVSAASPAQATPYCANRPEVGGAIEQRYINMGGPVGALGCPVTGELVNPDGFGRRQQFDHGTVYWSPRSGAWPVWGYIGDYWCMNGCERGFAGYPTSYEYRVGGEIRQNFQCTVIHFQDLGGGTTRTWSEENICA